jgi:hypothetical protein
MLAYFILYNIYARNSSDIFKALRYSSSYFFLDSAIIGSPGGKLLTASTQTVFAIVATSSCALNLACWSFSLVLKVSSVSVAAVSPVVAGLPL